MGDKILFYQTESYEQELIDRQVGRIFAALPVTEKLGPGSHVLLKPNLLTKHTPDAAVTTHPAVVRAVIRALKGRGVENRNIVLADSCGGLYNAVVMKGVYKASGLWQVCEEEGVLCYIDCHYGEREAPGAKLVHRFNLLAPVLEADFIIDLAKCKTHVMTGCTAATKNLFGCIPGLQKAELHTRFPAKEQFGDMLIDLLGTVRPSMAIVDGVIGMEGDGPAGGSPRALGLLLAGENTLTIDLAVCGLMGLDPMRVPYLAAANRRGLCAPAFDPSLLEGDIQAYGPIPGFKLPESYQGGDTDFAQHVPRLFRAPLKLVEKLVAPRPVVDKALCIGCGKCAEICPQHTIRLEGKAHIEPQNCIRCFCCHEMCPAKAIQVRKFSGFRL